LQPFALFFLVTVLALSKALGLSGFAAFEEGRTLSRKNKLEDAGEAYWKAILTWKEGGGYTLEDAYRRFMQTFADRKIPEQGPLYIARAYLDRKDSVQGVHYLRESINVKENAEALLLLAEHDTGADDYVKGQRLARAFELSSGDPALNVRMGHTFFARKELPLALLCFERAYASNSSNVDAFTNAVYIRSNIAKWGNSGETFQLDMDGLEAVVRREMATGMLRVDDVEQQSVIHPHMTLAYTLPPELKLAIAKSHAGAELALVKKAGIEPIDHRKMLSNYKKEFDRPGARIKVGYVSCSLKSKALVYLTQNLMGFHNRSRFEVHAYATTPPDDPVFLEKAMRGVDWRRKIKDSVEYFHETAGMDVLQLSLLIRKHGIHILVDWDGYSHNGIRPTGLFPIQSAPLQVVHQEYIGTMGASYFQFQVSDLTSSPKEWWQYHSEKFIMMPHTFFVNSFAYQMPDLEPPPLILPQNRQPGFNGCGGKPASFVYCNFNKHLKFDPQTFRGWLETLQASSGSILCLLEFPAESKPNLLEFVSTVDPKLVSRVRFQPFMNNPYDNFHRVVNMCHAVLDTPIYNGHTTSTEALFGGVPVVTRSDHKDMSALVGTSSLKTLGIPELIANSPQEYQAIAARLRTDFTFFNDTRAKLIASTKCSKSMPLNPLWDLQRYVRNLESGFQLIWENWLNEGKIETVFAEDAGPASSSCPFLIKKKSEKEPIPTRKSKGKGKGKGKGGGGKRIRRRRKNAQERRKRKRQRRKRRRSDEL